MAPFSSRACIHPAIHAKKRTKSKAKNIRNHATRNIFATFKRLKSEMEEISEEHKHIREGQRQVEEKFEAIESECEDLKRETRLIIHQSARTQFKLALMFRILKAKETGDFDAATTLTKLLRQMVVREEEEKEDDI